MIKRVSGERGRIYDRVRWRVASQDGYGLGAVGLVLCTGGEGFVRVRVCHVVLAAWCGESG